MIKLEKVNKYFNRFKKNKIHVINNTSLEFENHGLVSLLGPSGCGKTTLLNSMGGLDKVSSGKIFVNGKKLTRRPSFIVDRIRNLNIGYIFQDYLLIEDLTVFDNIALSLKMIGIADKEEVKKRVYYVLEKVGMYRYRNRPAAMLSGGERQRVGIARAIVKNPSVIIADEPTGNLDSKNTIEIMNIIKSISKEKLVILVTHEKDLAYFYSSRIIEIEDGKVISDKINEHNEDLDYRMDNKIYLKDIANVKNFNDTNYTVNCYSDKNEVINLDIVVKNGNIYVKSNTRNKIEIVDESTSIEFIDDHYKKITSEEYENYDFHQENFNNKLKYKSILNSFTLIINGFRKVFEYSFVKKLLLLGFFASGMFILYSVSNIFGVTNIKDEKFVNTNKEYLSVIGNVKVDDYLKYESSKNVNYILPGTSIVSFNVDYKDFYQTSRVSDSLKGSLSDINMLKQEDLIYGKMPEKENEVVVDKMSLDRIFLNNFAVQAGYGTYEKWINKKLFISDMKDFIIVGITDKKSPSIYVNKNMFINILSNSNESYSQDYYKGTTEENVKLIDYTLKMDTISLKVGRYPQTDYEIIVNFKNKETMPIDKYSNIKVNGQKLYVCGYYTDIYNSNYYLVNNNMIKYNIIENNQNIIIYPKNKDIALSEFRSLNLNIEDSYNKDKKEYVDGRKESVTIALVVAGTILIISFIEIFLIIRSSFLSRIKEVGIYRAIGVKKTDIYKMFYGEIIAITTLGGLTGIIFMYYIISKISKISFIGDMYMLNSKILILSLILMYGFNILVGLIPVFNVVRKRPAEILSRIDIE